MEKAKIIVSDEYEEYGAEFQFEMIKLLNKALLEHGITDKSQRQEICGTFTFDFSMLLDDGKTKDAKPHLAFHKKNQLFLKNEGFDFHEYAFGNVDEVFDEE